MAARHHDANTNVAKIKSSPFETPELSVRTSADSGVANVIIVKIRAKGHTLEVWLCRRCVNSLYRNVAPFLIKTVTMFSLHQSSETHF